MMGNAWTPGPWVFYAPNSWKDGLGYVRSHVQDGREIAHTGDTKTPAAENIANARLIAAAPEMAEALLFCAAVLGGLRNEGNAGDALCDAHNEARAIIARIRGDAP
jgi:hypothetical protein